MDRHTASMRAQARGGWRSRTVRLTVAAALAVAAGCAALLAAGRCGTVRPPSVTSTSVAAPWASAAAASESVSESESVPTQSAGPPGPTGTTQPAAAAPATPATPTASEQHSSRPSPVVPTVQSAAASSAPISASALVQFKVTSHWDDGYRAAVTVTNTGATPLTGWRLTFQVVGATLHQPTDTGETAMRGDVVTVTPGAWRPTLAAGAAATFGFGFDGVLAAPADCRIDGAPCELAYVPASSG